MENLYAQAQSAFYSERNIALIYSVIKNKFNVSTMSKLEQENIYRCVEINLETFSKQLPTDLEYIARYKTEINYVVIELNKRFLLMVTSVIKELFPSYIRPNASMSNEKLVPVPIQESITDENTINSTSTYPWKKHVTFHEADDSSDDKDEEVLDFLKKFASLPNSESHQPPVVPSTKDAETQTEITGSSQLDRIEAMLANVLNKKEE